MCLLVYPKDKKQEEVLTYLFKEMNVDFHHETDLPDPQLMEEIRESIQEIGTGNFYTHEEVMQSAKLILQKYSN